MGRADELSRLDALARGSRPGQGTLVRLEARSGDGKSRILDEAALAAAQRGHRVFRTEAHELEAPRPFAMLEGLAASILDAAAEDQAYADALADSPRPGSPELRTVLPSLHRFLADAEEGSSIPPWSAGSMERSRPSSMRSAHGTARRCSCSMTANGPTISRSVSSEGGRRRHAPAGFVTVVAATPPGGARRGPSSRSVGRRRRRSRSLPFDDDETRDLVSSMGGRFPDQAHAVIAQLSQGRPFFITSVVRGMVESEALRPGPGGWLLDPGGARHAVSPGKGATFITSRLRRLPEDTLAFLSAAAILGRHASTEECASLANDRAGLVDPDRGGGAASRSDLADGDATSSPSSTTRFERARSDVSTRSNDGRCTSVRRRLIERNRPGDVFDLAYHFDEAGASDRAQPAALEAASLARTRQAFDSAETMLRIAARGTPTADVSTRVRVAEDLGAVLMVRGAYEESARWLDEARSLVPPGERAAEIESKIGELAFKRGDVRTGAASIERALRMVGGRVPRRAIVLLPMLLGELLVQTLHSVWPAMFVGRRPLEEGANDLLGSRFHGRLGYAWWFERGKLATLWTHFRSLNLAERYPPTAELAQAYSEHAPAMMLVPWHRRGVRYAQRSHAIRVQLGDLWGQGQSLHFWGAGLYAASDSNTRRRSCACASRWSCSSRPATEWELNNCRLQIAMARIGSATSPAPWRTAARPGKRASRSGIAQARGIGLEGWAKATDGLVSRASHPSRAGAIERRPPHARERDAGRRGCGSWASATRRQRSESFEESQRLFRRAGMKNAGVSPVRPWLLTALLRAAEATPEGRAGEPPSSARRAPSPGRPADVHASTATTCPTSFASARTWPRCRAGADAPGALRAQHRGCHRQRAQAETLRTRVGARRGGKVALGWTECVDDGERAAAELRALIAALLEAQDRRCHVGERRRGSGRRVALPEPETTGAARRRCIDRQPIEFRSPPRGSCGAHGHQDLHGSSRVFADSGFSAGIGGVSTPNGVPAPPAEARPQMCGVGGSRGTHPLPGPSDPHFRPFTASPRSWIAWTSRSRRMSNGPRPHPTSS